MPRISYVSKRFRPAQMAVIEQANTIIEEYRAQGFTLTLRQLYYQFVARDLLPNEQREYKRLGRIISDARRAGLVDWAAIEDRTRNRQARSHWDTPKEIIAASARWFALDKWETQPVRIEVWVEKDALLGVIEPVCSELDVAYFACRGYPSDSEVWSAAQRFIEYNEAGQEPIILHLGDHDPSGIDMTRDISDRLALFMYDDPECPSLLQVKRIALNMDQVETYGPPPNPVKLTDSRATAYGAKYGTSSWELDALEPTVLADLIRDEVEAYRDEDEWEQVLQEEREHRSALKELALGWEG